MLGVLRGQKCTLMMVKPPANFWRGRIFEIDNGVLIAIEILFIEQSPRAMHETAKLETHIIADPLPVKTGKQRSRSSAIEAFIVKEDPDLHSALPFPLRNVKLRNMTFLKDSVNRHRELAKGLRL